jgi:hypothetical protein
LELVIVPGLVLCLGVENADVIQEAFKFTWSGLVLLVASQLFHCIDGTIRLPLLVVALGRARLVHVARLILLLLFSCVEGHLLGQGILVVMVNIASDVLGIFMGSLQIRDGSLSPFLKNITIELLSTSGMIFLLLQKSWMNSWRDSPFFWTTLVRS